MDDIQNLIYLADFRMGGHAMVGNYWSRHRYFSLFKHYRTAMNKRKWLIALELLPSIKPDGLPNTYT